MSIIDDLFQPIYGMPAWEVQQGIGSALTLEFGEPRLEIREPRRASRQASEKVRQNAARRHVYVRGAWHFVVWLCDWRIMLHSKECANQNSSRRIISAAIRELNGQALLQVSVRRNLDFKLKFDLGGVLEIIPNPEEDGTSSDLWNLFEPSGYCFSMRGDGKHCYMPGDTIPKDQVWLSLRAYRKTTNSDNPVESKPSR